MLDTLDLIAQFSIAVLGLSAIYMVGKKNRWGFVLGLAQQPFWFFTTIYHSQWIIFLTALAYTFSWAVGVQEWFFKKGESDA